LQLHAHFYYLQLAEETHKHFYSQQAALQLHSHLDSKGPHKLSKDTVSEGHIATCK
jgi:hypothetical protein